MIRKLGYPVVVALCFIALGFIFLGVAWDGAASVDCVQCQIPYLLSGGAVGLGLIIVGAGLLLFESGRRVIIRLEERIDKLNEAVLVGAVSTNGHAPVATEDAAVAPSPDAVVVGASSYHRQDCRLVEGKDDLTFASPEEAQMRGLSPCRVCDPTGSTARRKKKTSAKK